MSLARAPLGDDALRWPRLSFGAAWMTLYWLVSGLAAARAYAVAYERYAPTAAQANADALALTVARDAGLWAATATCATAFILFLAILALRQAGSRLLHDVRRRDA